MSTISRERRRKIWWPLTVLDHAGWFVGYTMILLIATVPTVELWW
jgi:hypothetical protein